MPSSVYDPEKEKTVAPGKAGEHDDLGTHPERREAEVADLENQFNAPSADKSKAEQEEAEQLGDGDWDTSVEDSGKKKRWFGLTGKQAAAGGGALAIVVGGGAGFFMFFSGPLEMIHLGEVLDKTSIQSSHSISDRMGNFASYNRRAAKTGDLSETRVTRYGSKRFHNIEAQLNEKGITFNDDNGHLTSIDVDMNRHPDFAGKAATLEQKKKWAAEMYGVDESAVTMTGEKNGVGDKFHGDAIARVDAGTSIKAKKAFTGTSLESLESGGIGNALNMRQIKKWYSLPSLFHPIDYAFASADEKLAGWSRARAIERENARQEESRKSIREASKDAREKLNSKLDPNVKATVAGAVMVAGALCTLRDLANGISEFNTKVIAQPSQIEATEKQALGSQLKSGVDVDMKQYGDITKATVDDNGDSIWGAKSLNALATNTAGQGQEIHDGYKQAFLPGAFNETIDTIINNKAADLVCSTGGQALQAVVGIGLLVTSGGETSLASNILKEGVKSAVTVAVMGVVQDLANGVFGSDPVKQFAGPQGGNLMAYGARSGQNISSMAMGAVALKDTDTRFASAEYEQEYNQEFQHKSLATRIFDVKDYRSLSGSMAMSLSSLKVTSSQSLISNLSPTKIFGSIASALTPHTFAAGQGYDWGFPVYGIPSSVMNDPAYQDPYQSADEAAKLFDASATCGGVTTCTDKAKTCFGATISKVNGMWQSKTDKPVNPNEQGVVDGGCDDMSNPNWKRTIMFVFDDSITKQVDCWEGGDESCADLGVDSGASSSSAASTGIAGVEMPPNMGPEAQNGYYLMPPATNGEYIFSDSADTDHYGSKELIGVIYTVAKKWKEKHPTSRIRIGDLNSRGGHLSHTTGIDVDITTEDQSAANISGNAEMSKELGHMFADTGIIKLIYYNDTAVQNDFNTYAANKGTPPPTMQTWSGHENHFHVRVLDTYKLQAGGQP